MTLVKSDALAIPDPRQSPVPRGWFASFAPVADSLAWDALDEAEAQILAIASYLESFNGDVVEFEKALRVIERRRGELLGTDVTAGTRTDLNTHVKVDDISPMTASRYRAIARAWDRIWPHLLEASERRDVTQSRVLKIAADRDTSCGADVDALASRTLDELSAGGRRYATIYADPPWLYGNQATRGATSDHYRGLTAAQIAELPVREMVADNAHLHLWTTNAFLFDARAVMEAWGFEYKSCFVWVKPQMGMGNYWRVSHEFCLFGIRGSAPFGSRSEMSWKEWPRGRHSAKPEQMYDLIETVSPGPYLELFARRRRDGWSAWGNEIESTLFFQEAS